MLRGDNDTRNAQALGKVPMSGMAVSALSRPNDFRALIGTDESPAITSWLRRDQVGHSSGGPQPVPPKPLSTPKPADVKAQSQAITSQGFARGETQTVSPSQALPTLGAETARIRIAQFVEALSEACELSNEMVAEGESLPINMQTMIYAVQSLAPLIASLKLPPPLTLPLQNGGIGTEWHASGMNVELRFRKPYDVYAVFEDARGVIPSYHGRDQDLVQARPVLAELSARGAK